jgi:hypothetical protein
MKRKRILKLCKNIYLAWGGRVGLFKFYGVIGKSRQIGLWVLSKWVNKQTIEDNKNDDSRKNQ